MKDQPKPPNFWGLHVGGVLRLKGVSYLKTGMTFREVDGKLGEAFLILSVCRMMCLWF